MTDQERGTESDQEEAEAKELITSWHKAHPVVEEVRVVDGETTWDYFIDIGDKSEVEKGNKKKDEPFENIDETIDVTSKVKMTTEPHTLHGNVEKGKLTLILKTDPTQLIPALQNALSTIKKGDPNRESLSSALNTAQEIEFEYNEKENQILKGERKGTNETMYEFHVRVKSAFLRKREAELAVQLEAMAKHYNIRELDDFFSEPPAERYIPVKEAGTYIRKELYDKMHKWTTFRNDYVKKNKPDLIKKIKFVQTSGNKNDWENLIDLGLVEKNSDIKSYDPNVITYAVDHIDPVANLWNTEGFNSDDTTRRDHFLDEDNLQLVTHQWNSAKGSEGEYYKKFVTLGFTSSIATDVDINGMRFWDAAKNPI